MFSFVLGSWDKRLLNKWAKAQLLKLFLLSSTCDDSKDNGKPETRRERFLTWYCGHKPFQIRVKTMPKQQHKHAHWHSASRWRAAVNWIFAVNWRWKQLDLLLTDTQPLRWRITANSMFPSLHIHMEMISPAPIESPVSKLKKPPVLLLFEGHINLGSE